LALNHGDRSPRQMGGVHARSRLASAGHHRTDEPELKETHG
jgi:hypothetical protein